MEAFAKFLELLKVPTNYVVGALVMLLLIIFIPESIVSNIGFSAYRKQGQSYLWVALIFTIFILLSRLIGAVAKRYVQNKALSIRKKRLHVLTVDEKEILRQYIEDQTRTVSFPVGEEIVASLVAEKILVRVSNVGVYMKFPYSIQPWVWEYLNDHSYLLSNDYHP